ncbi:cation:proton antiporter [Bifidobacterium aquikefiricola]|uniref:Cation:proton antiporter n=1 Tax=Bifidobacterium aquikefiricola TaxID=3059038 RepID=A0AB39U703_9BIFI
MESFTLILCIIGAVLVSSFISRFIPRISTPLVQILLGALMTVLPIVPSTNLDPELFMVLFIAPLLYYEAHSINKQALLKNLRLSLSLAIGLASVTMLAVGYSLHGAWLSIPLAAAFALGAALGPTDAVAVSSIGRVANLSERQRSILNGESLFNDATGVIGFQFAIYAASTGSFSAVGAVSQFLFSFIGGIAVGAVAGLLMNWVFETSRHLGWETTTTRILLEIFFPFLLYLIAEHVLHISGVLAVVTGGLLARFDTSGIGPNVSRTNIVSSSVWTVLSFSLNGAVFVLLGMLLPNAMMSSWSDDNISHGLLIEIIVLVSLVVILMRFIWISAMLAFTKDMVTGERRPMSLERWRSAAIMTFGGPKGTITLSLALTIPYTVRSGAWFPMRDELIFIAAGVIIVTLLLANFALQALAPPNTQGVSTKFVEAVLEVLRRTIERLSEHDTPENHHALRMVLSSYNQRIARLKSQIGQHDSKELERLQIIVLNWERDYIETRITIIEQEIIDFNASHGDESEELAAMDSDDTGNMPVTSPDNMSEKALEDTPELSDERKSWQNSKIVSQLTPLQRFESERQAAERILVHISRTLSHISEASEMRWRLRSLRRRTHNLAKGIESRVRHSTPLVSDDTIYAVSRRLHLDLNRYVIEKLYAELAKPDFNTEDVLSVIIEHQRAETALRARPSVNESAHVLNGIQEIKREGYAIELEVIQNMFESGDITRAEARQLRRNVYVMQVDADSNL